MDNVAKFIQNFNSSAQIIFNFEIDKNWYFLKYLWLTKLE